MGLFDRALIALHPALKWMAPRSQTDGAAPSQKAYPSSMLSEHNCLHRLIFTRPFKMVIADSDSIAALKAEAERATIVYISKPVGQFEYNYFNDLFLKEDLPLAAYSNAITLRRFMKWKTFWASVKQGLTEIGEKGRPSDPLEDGRLAQMIADGKSAFITIWPSELADDGLYLTGPVRTLTAIIEAGRKSARPVSLIPLEFLWSKRPAKTRLSDFDLVFGEKERPGSLRRLVHFWRNYMTHAEVSIGDPIDLGSFVQWEGGDDLRIAARLRGFLIGAMGAQRRTITGPPVRPRSWFVNEVTSDEKLDDALCRVAAQKGKPTDDIRDLAASYAHEIAADIDCAYLEIANRIFSFALKRIYESLRIDMAGLKRAKELYAEGAVVFVPNHKSHMDYLILAHALYHNGMTVPHIAAGVNLRFWPIGNIFRRCGAFFIRRTFRGNQIYKSVLETYLKVLLKEGYSLEFFIEGGRSRTGKLLKPKFGMLLMLCHAAAEANIRNLHFIPVSITYDRVIEEKSYTMEQEGALKEKEKPSQLLKLTKYLRRQKQNFGSIYINFGKPVPAAGGIETTAQEICRELNRKAVATPTAIAAAAILASARQGVRIGEVKKNWVMILNYLESRGAMISDRIRTNPATVFDEAISKLSQARLVQPHGDSVEPFYAVPENKRIALAYFKNCIAHFLVTIGIVSRLIVRAHKSGLSATEENILADFEISKRLLAHEFSFATEGDDRDHVATAMNFLKGKDFESVQIFATMIRPYVEALWIALRCAANVKTAIEKKALVDRMMQTGHDLLLLGQVYYRESITKIGFENTLEALVAYKIFTVEEKERGKKQISLYLPTNDGASIQTLKAELERLF